jgi:hypothetical protein
LVRVFLLESFYLQWLWFMAGRKVTNKDFFTA